MSGSMVGDQNSSILSSSLDAERTSSANGLHCNRSAEAFSRYKQLDESIYGQKTPNPKKLIQQFFLMDFGSFDHA